MCQWAGETPTVDAFASSHNRRFRRFWDKDANSFDQFRGKVFLWTNTPFSLMTDVVNKIVRDRARGIIIIPTWVDKEWFAALGPLAHDW